MRHAALVKRLFVYSLLAISGLAVSAAEVSAQRAVLVVRHAEKIDESEDALLSPAGLQRAQALARDVGRSGVTQIFVTQLQRTQQTAAPLAAALKLKPIVMTANTTAPMVERIRREHPDDVVLIVGHSNTVPAILKEFGHPEPVVIQPDEYDSLFVLVPRGPSPPSVVRLRY